MVPIENQERPNIKSVYTCSNCEKALFDGDDDHPRWNFCPMCGQEIEWDKSAKVVWEEKNCNVCGGGGVVGGPPVGLLSATLQVFGMPQATILGWIPATPVGSRSALRPTALAVSEGTIRTASGLI